MKIPMRIIGDVHGNHGRYVNLIKKAEFSVQLGDMGFDYSKFDKLDETRHRFVPGNHDNYDNLPPHAFQADWGQVSMGPIDFFYIRGAYSVDKMMRRPHISWWPQEEMGWNSGTQLVETIAMMQPKIILSHDCPHVCHRNGVLSNAGKINPSLTVQIMSAVWEVWKPDLWIFGHHHHNWDKQLDKTRFLCLNELSCADFLDDGQLRITKMNSWRPGYCW